MHMRKTKFAKRINRAASAVESRGIRTTYALHDRVLHNRAARKRFGSARPTLDAVQARVLGELREEGYCVVPFSELFDAATWQAVAAEGDRFVDETELGLSREAAGEESGLRRSTKTFLVRRNAWGESIPADDPWLAAALNPRVLDIANSYLGLWAKLEYLDLWHTPKTDAPERVSSQRWHRDFNDRLLLKAFVYLNDVGPESGPFEYVPGSFPDGRLGSRWPWWPGYDGYPSDREWAETMGDATVKTFTAPRGTMILCNTAGFHRGGYATGGARSLATWTYCSPAALKALSERNYTPFSHDVLSQVTAAARFALS